MTAGTAGTAATAGPAPRSFAEAPVVELRQYTLHPGGRDRLVEVFERHLVDPQEAVGMRLGGTFHDLDDAERFVWWRGFAGMPARRAALEAFYGGPVWAAHRDVANATMVDSDDVLLLRPTVPAHPPAAPSTAPSASTDGAGRDDVVAVGVLVHAPDEALTERLATAGHAALEAAFGTTVATYRTEPAANTFPALPVRDDHAFVWTTTCPGTGALDAGVARLAADPVWAGELAERLAGAQGRAQLLRLAPTSRSRHPAPDRVIRG